MNVDDFRVITDAASLKQGRVQQRGDHGRYFRVITDAASLKRDLIPTLAVNPPELFPRHHRRGLIEALSFLVVCVLFVKFPRHHRRGLIEARHATRNQTGANAISASSQTRPH